MTTVATKGVAVGAGAYTGQRHECCDIDLAADGDKVVNWKFVGEGRGEFELVQAFSFVGEKGSWQKEVVDLDKNSRFRKRKLCTAVLAAFVLVAATMCAVRFLFEGRKSHSFQATA